VAREPNHEQVSKDLGLTSRRALGRLAFALVLALVGVATKLRLERPNLAVQPAASAARALPRLAMLRSSHHVQGALPSEPTAGRAGDAEAPLAADDAHSATVTGRVVDASGGVVAGAVVVARGAEQGSSQSVAAVSAGDGSFRLAVRAGPAELSAQAEAYSRMIRRIDVPARDVILVLAPGSSLSGHIVADGTGAAIAAARIAAINLNGVLLPGVESESRADGSFRIAGLPAGGYTLWARAEGWQDRRAQVVLALDDAAEVTMSLGRAAVLHARVSVAGRPCDGASVLLDGQSAVSGVAASDGKLSITNAAPGRYRASVKCANALPHEEELELTGQTPVERHFELESGLTLRGTVERANGQPFPGAPVLAVPVPADSDSAVNDQAASSNGCAADATGAFACRGLRADVYDVTIDGHGRERGPKVRVALRPGVEPMVVLRAHASGTIRVSLVGSVGAEAIVLAAPAAAEPGTGLLRGSAQEGRFVFDDVKLGSYRVYLGSAANSTTEARLEHDAQVLEVELGVPKPCSISGSVVDEAGVPVPDAWVRASSDDDFTHARAGSGSPALSDTAGAFTISGLFEGDYRLNVSSGYSETSLGGVRCIAGHAAGARLVLSSRPALAEP
jgi:hypothetical protein